MKQALVAAVLVPAAALAFGACTSAPEFTQFHTPQGGPPLPKVQNDFLNAVQHKLDRPLDNDKAVAAAIGANFKCLTYIMPMLANTPMPVPDVPGMSDEDRELFRTALDMATPQSGPCQEQKAKDDREKAESAANQARIDAEARARKDAEDRQYAEQQASLKRKAQQEAAELEASQNQTATTTNKKSSPQTSSGSSGASPQCDIADSGQTYCAGGSSSENQKAQQQGDQDYADFCKQQSNPPAMCRRLGYGG